MAKLGSNWVCPFCEHASVVVGERHSSGTHYIDRGFRLGRVAVTTEVLVCSNEQCRELVLRAEAWPWKSSTSSLGGSSRYFDHESDFPIHRWDLIPEAAVRPYPEYVPEAIRNDYREACLIRTRSPKAAATMARRCLQGMIRDRWGVTKRTLKKEIDALEELVEPLTWKAIDAVREIGNIGAHMEEDVNLIVEIDEGEAGLLIELIETLIEDWYIQRHAREERLKSLVETNFEKQAQRRGAVDETDEQAGSEERPRPGRAAGGDTAPEEGA